MNIQRHDYMNFRETKCLPYCDAYCRCLCGAMGFGVSNRPTTSPAPDLPGLHSRKAATCYPNP
ncbi:hypothetical protein BD779DRAFT_1506294 [Infundibulicybe gibba]|nr:hypothetical protein BD779DRAFT_1506294 [Infundibulicybe gibba]